MSIGVCGGWTLEAAEAVCVGEPIDTSVVLDHLGALVDKSLVLADEQSDGEMRYRLLETLRVYAAERLAEVVSALPHCVAVQTTTSTGPSGLMSFTRTTGNAGGPRGGRGSRRNWTICAPRSAIAGKVLSTLTENRN